MNNSTDSESLSPSSTQLQKSLGPKLVDLSAMELELFLQHIYIQTRGRGMILLRGVAGDGGQIVQLGRGDAGSGVSRPKTNYSPRGA
jgi:hypothetical protein